MIGLDWTVLALVAAAAVFAYLLKSHRPPAPFLWVPSTPLFTPTWKSRWSFLPQAFFIASLGLGALAALDPRWETLLSSETYTPPPTKGIALCLILDRSGSMTAKGRGGKSRIDQLKIQSQAFVKKRPQDLLGLIAFARSAEVLTPLTLDHQDLLHALQNLQVVPQKEQDGTAIGYAIYKGAEMMGAIQAFTGYTLKGMAMIVVTDGLQDPNPLDAGKRLRNMDIEEASDKAAEKGFISIFSISIPSCSIHSMHLIANSSSKPPKKPEDVFLLYKRRINSENF